MSPLKEVTITSSDKTFVSIRTDIVNGVILAGSKLNETELSTKYQVSRAIIRESINKLVNTNLVERKSNVGAKVVTLSHQGLIQLYQVRESLEGMAARLAAQNMSENEIERLQILLDEHFEGVKNSESYYQEAGDVDFHYRIALGTHNQYLMAMLMDNIYHLVRMYRVQLGMVGPRVTTAFSEHQHIAQAIANRDPELAELLMRRHITYSMNNIAPKLLTNKNALHREDHA